MMITAYNTYVILSTRAVQQPICFQMSFDNNKKIGRLSIGIREFQSVTRQYTSCVTPV